MSCRSSDGDCREVVDGEAVIARAIRFEFLSLPNMRSMMFRRL